MAGSVNKVILVGNLGRDPEIRSTQGGSKLANFSVATSETWSDRQSGERRERTQWHRIVIYNERLVEVAEKYLRKGMKVYLEGALESRQFTDKNGQERETTEVVLRQFRGELQMLDRAGEGAGGGESGGFPRSQAPARAGRGGGERGSSDRAPPSERGAPSWDAPKGGDLDDEIPF
ncbi:single-stranded DNA-binding protein [Acidisphaera rubrifaciens]|uniref:Single-stranded DNA-binding protein n=1 Tax=Acidisphaera rubrifaciens HS-AP3 TaxID=1231350 RepID=A0A0D6P9J1_9PROT|nr:single-stranded DNA-binding protein [Acidisphaera rubrifaciens]GAN78430.1 single-stranded DNA-binding protein Ssb [Acidisphaera rubrifaciens HS-AP3]